MTNLENTNVQSFWQSLIQHPDFKAAGENEPALYALDDIGVISIQGPDTESFLQGQLTTDTASQNDGTFLLSGHCDHKGRLNSNFFLCRAADNHFYLMLPKEQAENARLALNKYAVFSKAELTDQSEQFAVISGALERRASDFENAGLLSFSCDTRGAAQPWFDFELGLIPLKDEELLLSTCLSRTWANTNVWHLNRVRSGIGFIYPYSQAEHIPQMLNMDLLSAIDWNKGCYTGQEIIARMHYRGSTNRRCFVFESSESVPDNIGDLTQNPEEVAILNNEGDKIGNVLEWARLNGNQPLTGLAVLKLKSLGDWREDVLKQATISIKNQLFTITISPPAYLASQLE